MHRGDQLALPRRHAGRSGAYRLAHLLMSLLLAATMLPGIVASPATVAAATTPPEPILDRATTEEATPVLIDVFDNDLPEGDDSLVIAAVGKPTSGTAEITDGSILYTPNPHFSGEDSFFYAIHNGDPANTRQATVQVMVTQVDDGPSDIALNVTTIPENTPLGKVFAQFTVDSDSASEVPITAVDLVGTGNDNAKFAIIERGLMLKAPLDFETKKTYQIDVRARNLALSASGVTKRFTITATDANDAPTAIGLSKNQVAEQQPAGTTIGTLTSTDADAGNTHTYALVAGVGSTDNAKFRIDGSTLKTNAPLDFNEKPVDSIRIATTDSGGGTFEQIFLVRVSKTQASGPAAPASCSGDPITLIESADALVEIGNLTVSNASATGCSLVGTMKIVADGNTISNLAFSGTVNQRDQFSTSKIADFTMNLAGVTMKASKVEILYTNEQPMLHIVRPDLVMPADFGGLSAQVTQPTFIDNGGVRLGTGKINLPTISTVSGFVLELTGSLEKGDGGLRIVADGTLGMPNIGKKNEGDKGGQACSISAGVTIFANTQQQMVMVLQAGAPKSSTLGPPSEVQALATRAASGFQLEAIRAGVQCSPGLAIGNTGLFLTGLSGEITLIPGDERVDVTVTIEGGPDIPGLGAAFSLEGSMGFQPRPFELDLGVALSVLSIEVANADAKLTTSSFQTSIRFRAVFYNGSASINAFTSKGHATFTGSARVSLEIQKGWIVEGKRCRFIRVRICPPPLPPFNVGPLGTVGADVGEFTNHAFGFKGFVKVLGFGTHGFYVDHKGRFKFGNVSSYKLVDGPSIAAARDSWASAVKQGNAAAARAASASQGYTFLENVGGVAGNNGVIVNTPLTKPQLTKEQLRSISATDVISKVNLLQHGDVVFNMMSEAPLAFTVITPEGQEVTPANYDQSATLGYKIDYTQTTQFEQGGTNSAEDVAGPRLLFTPLAADAAVNGLDLRVDGTVVYVDLDFQQSHTWLNALPLAAGSHLIELVQHGTNTVVRSANVTLADGSAQTSVVNVGGAAPGMVTIADDTSAPSAQGQSKLRFFNGTSQALSLFVDGAPLLSNVAYKGVSAFAEIGAGTKDITLRNSGGTVVAQIAAATLANGGVYTFMSTDFTAGANPITIIQRADALYQPTYLTYYSVDQAKMNQQWQMKVVGDTDTIFYALSVQGPDSPPILGSVAVNASNLAAAQVKWQLTSDNNPTHVSIYANPGEISASVPLTQTDGTEDTQSIPQYEGKLLAEYDVTNVSELGGQLVTKQLDLTTLPSGTYHIWVRADDGVNPPINTYAGAASAGIAAKPSVYGTNAMWVAKDDFDPMASVSAAAAIVINHSADWPSSWDAAISTSFDTDTKALFIAWGAQSHPDIDEYKLLVGDVSGTYTQEIVAGDIVQELDADGNAIGAKQGSLFLEDVQPGKTYHMAIEGVDFDGGRTVRSQEFTFSAPAGSFSIASTQSTVKIAAGSTVSVPVTLHAGDSLFYPNVWLSTNLGKTPVGITARFADDLDGLTTIDPTSPTHQLEITVDASVPNGVYPITVAGYSGDARENLTIQVIVGELSVYLPLISR